MKNKTFPYTPAAVVTVIILTAGVLIRVWEIGNQIILGDEWHSINIAASSDFISIFTDFFQGSHSTPVALYYHFLLYTNLLNELFIYLPVAISGILLLIIGPVLVRGFFDDRTVLLFMAFLAFAPILAFYSRYARPYSMVTLVSFVSLVSCFLWWTKGKQKHGYVYVVSGALAGYFHIIAFPFVLAPILYILAYQLLKPDHVKTKLSWWKIVGPLTTLAIVLATLFGWQVKGILLASENRVGQADFTFFNVFSGFEALITGSHNHFVFGSFIILTFTSLYLSRQQEKIRSFFRFLVFPVIFQFLFLLLTKPVAGDAPHIFARYLIMTLPVFLLMVAYALDELIRKLKNKQLQTGILSLIVLLITLNFPWRKFIQAPANSRNTVLLAQMIYGRHFEEKVFENYLPETRPFYEEYVKTFENDITIVETPFNISFYAMPVAQFLHRKNVLAGYWDSDTVNDFSVYSSVNVRAIGELKQSINIIDPNAYDDKKDYLIIFHKRLNSENTIQIKRYADEVEALLFTVNPILGDPVYEDDFVRVFLQSNDE